MHCIAPLHAIHIHKALSQIETPLPLIFPRMLDCDAHRCKQVCHPGPCQPCPLSPRLAKTCPCGQTPLAKLLELGYSDAERETCSDPIPSCGKTCSKPLACGSNGRRRETGSMLFIRKSVVLVNSYAAALLVATGYKSFSIKASRGRYQA